ncbi:MAG: hypothetical protein EBZ48_05890 [Proteobacteria bacterium]|nr:hypothetical protein [Pseudomonadota bacterium]
MPPVRNCFGNGNLRFNNLVQGVEMRKVCTGLALILSTVIITSSAFADNPTKRAKVRLESPDNTIFTKQTGTATLVVKSGDSPRSSFSISAKAFVAGKSSTAQWKFSGMTCPLKATISKVKSKTDTSTAQQYLAKLTASLKQVGGVKKNIPAGCEITTEALAQGGLIEIFADGAVRLKGNLPKAK